MKLVPLLFACVVLVSVASALEIYPRPSTLVNDRAGILDNPAALEQQLQAIKESGRAEIAILTIQSLETEAIEDYSIRTAEAWKLGTAEQDNGLLIVIAVQDRAYRFEVGYGLEGSLNDARVGRIGRDVLAPAFREGNYQQGLSDSVSVIDGILQQDPEIIAAVDEAPGIPPLFLAIATFIGGSIVSAIAWKQKNWKRKLLVFGIGDILVLAGIIFLASWFVAIALVILLMTAIPGRGFLPWFGGGFGGHGGGRIGGGGSFGGGGAGGRW